MSRCRSLRQLALLGSGLVIVMTISALAQLDTTRVLGRVIGPSGELIAKARVELTNLEQGTRRTAFTTDAGLYVFPNLRPGQYSLSVTAPGFRTVLLKSLTLYTQQDQQQNFFLTPGSPLEAINGESTGTPVATAGTVGTIVDSALVRDLPLNGRSFQTLFQLTPGIVLTQTDFANRGQFSMNGQRSNSNAVYVDGVSANFDVSPGLPLGQSAGGSLPLVTAFGGTNALASVDDVHEFVILASTYAPEFGRFSGGQVSIVTRSGTHQLHGDIFEYFRNEAFDANDWFANKDRLPRPAIRQNDFGAVLGGPVPRKNIFWFASYEGLRLQQPTSQTILVPSMSARQVALHAIQPYLQAYPLPTSADEGNGLAPAVYSFSNPSTLSSFSTKIDLQPTESVRVFGRYFQSQSDHRERGAANTSLSSVTFTRFTSKGITLGFIAGTNNITDVRFSFGKSLVTARDAMDSFGGALPLSPIIPAAFSLAESLFQFTPDGKSVPLLSLGRKGQNRETQINLIDNTSFRIRTHTIKLGFDLRRIFPRTVAPSYLQQTFFIDVASALAGEHAFSSIGSTVSVTSSFLNYSAYIEDTWSLGSSSNLTVGIRWDFNPPPDARGSNGSLPVTLTGIGQSPKPEITASHNLYRTSIANIAPRLGFSYSFGKPVAPVLQIGCGVFYDLGDGPAGNAVSSTFYPFISEKILPDITFPLPIAAASPPSLHPPAPPFATIQAFPQELLLPYSLQWSFGLQQPIGKGQSVTATYLGSMGGRLLRTEEYIGATAVLPTDFTQILLTNNAGISRYNSLQIRYQNFGRAGLHTIATYVFSHSRDSVSSDALFEGIPSRFLNSMVDYSDSDFDVRHTVSVGLDYELRQKNSGRFKRLISLWAFAPVFWYRSAQPVDVTLSRDIGFGVYNFRPDIVPGAPLYINGGKEVPGSLRLNAAAFSIPFELRQGTAPRNVARGFRLIQMDVSVSKQLARWRQLGIKAQVEAFNVFNHPNFSVPSGFLGTVLANGKLIRNAGFGLSQQNFAQGLESGNAAKAGFSPLYQVGGPRSLQAALRVEF